MSHKRFFQSKIFLPISWMTIDHARFADIMYPSDGYIFFNPSSFGPLSFAHRKWYRKTGGGAAFNAHP